ncbi:MAG: autotransporter-associated beta strand repeat-containing protein [Phycisphaerae bacterium]
MGFSDTRVLTGMRRRCVFNPNSLPSKTTRLWVPLAVLVAMQTSAFANVNTCTWVSSSGDGTWTTAANWAYNDTPAGASGSDVVYGTLAQHIPTIQNLNAGSYYLNSIQVGLLTNTYSLIELMGARIRFLQQAGSQYTPGMSLDQSFGNSGSTMGSGIFYVHAPVTLYTDITLNVNVKTQGTLYNIMDFDFAIDGTNNITIMGGGLVSFDNSSNSYQNTDIQGGIFQIASAGCLGTGTVTLENATLRTNNGMTIAKNIILKNTPISSFIDTQSYSVGISGVISNANGTTSGFTKIGIGTLTLSGTNTYTGGTLIDGGVLTINADSGLGNAPASTATNLTFDGGTGGTLRTGGSMTLNANRNVLLTASAFFDTQSYILTIPGTISGTGSLTKVGTGSLVLSGTNTYSGSTTVSGGTLDLSSDGALGNSTTLTIADGATVKVDTTGPLQVTTLNITGTGKLNLNKHDLIWHGGVEDTARGWLEAGYSGGTWSGNGITSSCDVGYGYGMMSGSIWQALYPGQQFYGVTVNPNDVLLHYTRLGDTTLKGFVDATDFAQIDAAYLKGIYATSGAHWLNGDSNYDGKIDDTDFARMSSSFNPPSGGGQAPTTTTTTTNAGSQAPGGTSSVPGSTNALLGIMVISGDWVPTAEDILAWKAASGINNPNFQVPQIVQLATINPSDAVSNATSVVTTAPEPSTLGIAAIGTMGLLKRRMRSRK